MKTKNQNIILGLLSIIFFTGFSDSYQADFIKIFPPLENQLCELPSYVAGVERPVTELAGEWELCQSNNQADWNANGLVWQAIVVPGEPAMQGFTIEHDAWYAYRKDIEIPKDFAGKTVILRFNGVYSHAKVWMNGIFVREHQGGFTSWDCDITGLIRPGGENRLVLSFSDRKDEISYASGYAKHPIGGILRKVELIVLPRTYIDDLHVETRFDESFENARLSVNVSINGPYKKAKVNIELVSPSGSRVKLRDEETGFADGPSTVLENVIEKPEKWDAEHPVLYELTATLTGNGKTESIVRKIIGFRRVEVKGNQVLVNGSPVRLRGACRHDIHPLLGRSASEEYDLKDVLRAKEANMNFIRTSHYPPSREFLQYCDQYGLYVEEETAVCFVSAWRSEEYLPSMSTENDTAFTSRYMGQLSEMIERDRDHPSVIIWSIGNENKYGMNFRKEFDYIRMTDPSRPVMFSYPGNGGNDKIYDILSMHYPSFEGNAEEYGFQVVNFSCHGIPVLNDEWAHVPCYNRTTLAGDPNVRDFWGESLDRMWSGCFEAEGCLGGAIWGMIDETFMLPDTCVGYGQWGILDTWRRRKPEFWNTQKAYSPVRLGELPAAELIPAGDMKFGLHNRYDHTNINELKITCNGRVISSPDIPPRQSGLLAVPGNLAGLAGNLEISFYRGEALIDRYQFKARRDKAAADLQSLAETPIRIKETVDEVMVSGKSFEVTFSRRTGLILSAFIKGEKIVESGPFLTLVSQESNSPQTEAGLPVETAGEWRLVDFQRRNDGHLFTASVKGHSAGLAVRYAITITDRAEISIDYSVNHGLKSAREAGIYLRLPGNLDHVRWDRDAYWNHYPDGHLGRPRGDARKTSGQSEKEQYRTPPAGTWENDTKDFYLFQRSGKRPGWLPVPNDFRSTRSNVHSYSITNSGTGAGFTVVGGGRQACRPEVDADGSIKLLILGHIRYTDLDWGNYEGSTRIEDPLQSEVRLKLIP
jgi:beta-galactosidase